MTKKNILAAVTAIVICLIACSLAISVTDRNHNNNSNYSTDTWITTPEYQTDATRAINAYEKLMDRYMDTMDDRFSQINDDSQFIAQNLTMINTKLDDLSIRISRIEKALGIDPNSSKQSSVKAPKH